VGELAKNYIRKVHIELTRVCNLNCRYCINKKDGAELKHEKLIKLLDELADAGAFHITFTGGEPFILRNIFYYIEQARDRGFRVDILSNGTLISRDAAKKLYNYGINEAGVSLYGASEETYEAFTGKRMFKKAVEGIENLLAAGIKVYIAYNINAVTCNDTPLINGLFANRRNVELKFSTGVSAGRHCDQTLTECKMPLEKILPKLKQWGIIIKSFKKPVEPFPESDDPLPCHAGTERCYIAADGKVFPCAVFPVEAGNIYKQSLKEIWRNSKCFNALRKLRFEDYIDCKVCEFKKTCMFRCPAHSQAVTNTFVKCPKETYTNIKALHNFWKGL
jgi:radical SAM protein with 4Fe4S-binding SPASM domain